MSHHTDGEKANVPIPCHELVVRQPNETVETDNLAFKLRRDYTLPDVVGNAEANRVCSEAHPTYLA